MIERFLELTIIYFFMIVSSCVFVPFVRNIDDDGIDGIKETFDMFTDKDFYLDIVIPLFIRYSIIYIFCSLLAFAVILVIDKINLKIARRKTMDRLELKLRIFEKIFPENMSNVYAGQNIDTVLKVVNKIYSNFIEI